MGMVWDAVWNSSREHGVKSSWVQVEVGPVRILPPLFAFVLMLEIMPSDSLKYAGLLSVAFYCSLSPAKQGRWTPPLC